MNLSCEILTSISDHPHSYKSANVKFETYRFENLNIIGLSLFEVANHNWIFVLLKYFDWLVKTIELMGTSMNLVISSRVEKFLVGPE